MKRKVITDAWYESELPTRTGMIQELQRIALRTRARPVRVIVLAALMTAAIGYKVTTKRPLQEAEVVIAMTEGSLAQKDAAAPVTVEDLKEYVTTVLLPDDALLKLIEKRDLYRIRKTLGNEFAIAELREQIEITVWKNSFIYYDEDIPNAEHSARIGITVLDKDPDMAIQLARDLGGIVIQSSEEHQRQIATSLAKDIAALREGLASQLDALAQEHSQRVTDLITAQRDGKPGLAAALSVRVAEIEARQDKLELELSTASRSRDAVADRIAVAGLDMSVQIVEEHHPERSEHGNFVLILVLVVVGLGSLAGSALVFGAFDARLHDLEDLTRLGIPVLGHIPGFPGDQVGSLDTRGVPRRRVPSFLRWRSQQ